MGENDDGENVKERIENYKADQMHRMSILSGVWVGICLSIIVVIFQIINFALKMNGIIEPWFYFVDLIILLTFLGIFKYQHEKIWKLYPLPKIIAPNLRATIAPMEEKKKKSG